MTGTVNNPIRTGYRTLAIGASATLLAVALPLATASSASAVEKRGGCSQGKAHCEFDVEKDDGRFEVDFEVDSNVRGQKWRLTLHHDGKRVFRDVRTTNREGEVGFERNRPNTAGRDAFRAKAVNLGTARSARRGSSGAESIQHP